MMKGTLMLYNLNNIYKMIIIINHFFLGGGVYLFVFGFVWDFFSDSHSKGIIIWKTYTSICYAMPISIKAKTRIFHT